MAGPTPGHLLLGEAAAIALIRPVSQFLPSLRHGRRPPQRQPLPRHKRSPSPPPPSPVAQQWEKVPDRADEGPSPHKDCRTLTHHRPTPSPCPGPTGASSSTPPKKTPGSSPGAMNGIEPRRHALTAVITLTAVIPAKAGIPLCLCQSREPSSLASTVLHWPCCAHSLCALTLHRNCGSTLFSYDEVNGVHFLFSSFREAQRHWLGLQ
jgi:hypothetical protein